MPAIRIANNSVSVVVSGYAVADIKGEPTVVYLDIAPQHPKSVGAIWASLVSGTKEWVSLSDDEADVSLKVRGINRRYHRLTADAPRVASRARPKHVRLVAPMACQIASLTDPFVVLAWTWTDKNGETHHLSPATALAAMLEQNTPLPMRMAWGQYVLDQTIARGSAIPLMCGGNAPEGYLIQPTEWEAVIAEGVTLGHLSLKGE